MTESPSQQPGQQTAKIYQFPVRTAAARGPLRDVAHASVALPAHVAMCDFGSGWYHDAAMQDEARKRAPR